MSESRLSSCILLIGILPAQFGMNPMKSTIPVFSLSLIVLLISTVGCGGNASATPETFNVTGKVTYEGQPVGEGFVQVQDSTSGRSAQGAIAADGTFSLQAPAGTYQVAVVPPTVEVDLGPDSPPSEEFKAMENIPDAYRTFNSGVSVTVSGDMDNADIAMTKQAKKK